MSKWPKHEDRKEYLKAYYLRIYAERKAEVDMAKEGPCADCGIAYGPAIMDLDHVPERGKKVAAIGTFFNWHYDRNKFETELAKCDVVCPTCHWIRTVARSGS